MTLALSMWMAMVSREDPDGNKLTINFASMSGGEVAQPLADYYVQQWQEIGLMFNIQQVV